MIAQRSGHGADEAGNGNQHPKAKIYNQERLLLQMAGLWKNGRSCAATRAIGAGPLRHTAQMELLP
jgi:hypothetical protein